MMRWISQELFFFVPLLFFMGETKDPYIVLRSLPPLHEREGGNFGFTFISGLLLVRPKFRIRFDSFIR